MQVDGWECIQDFRQMIRRLGVAHLGLQVEDWEYRLGVYLQVDGQEYIHEYRQMVVSISTGRQLGVYS